MNDEAFNLVKGRLSQHRQCARPGQRTEPTQQEIDDLFSERITPETVLPPMQPLIRMFGEPCFYRGELVADCGKAKSGKTFFLSILMTACLTRKALALERIPAPDSTTTDIPPLRVLWMDTEQSQQSTQEIICKRIIPLAESVAGESGTKLTENLDGLLYAFNLRGLGFEKRQRMVDVAVRAVRPDICIIDGVKDLMTDINDAVQATLIMERLMALAKEQKCCIVCVLHQNKSEQDRNMRGSIGTELTNKAFEVFQCEVADDSGTFKVSHTYSRKRRMKRRLYYTVNNFGLPEELDDYCEQPRDDRGRWVSRAAVEEADHEVDLRRLFTSAMEGRTQRPFGEVMAIALKKCGVVDAKAYYRYLDLAVGQEIVRKRPNLGSKISVPSV